MVLGSKWLIASRRSKRAMEQLRKHNSLNCLLSIINSHCAMSSCEMCSVTRLWNILPQQATMSVTKRLGQEGCRSCSLHLLNTAMLCIKISHEANALLLTTPRLLLWRGRSFGRRIKSKSAWLAFQNWTFVLDIKCGISSSLAAVKMLDLESAAAASYVDSFFVYIFLPC